MNDILYKYCHYKNDLGDIIFKWKQVVPTHQREEILLKTYDIPRAGHMRDSLKRLKRSKLTFIGRECFVKLKNMSHNAKFVKHRNTQPKSSMLLWVHRK